MRKLHPGMGQAVAERTVLREKGNGELETWQDVAFRVARGNTSLVPDCSDMVGLEDHIGNGRILMSGRHLQQGDEWQHRRNMEVFTNCGHRDTRLLTQEFGVTSLGEIAGHTVTVRCKDGQWRPAVAKSYGQQELFDMVFRRYPKTGPALRVTERFTRNHRWVLEDGSVTDAIRVGDRLQPAVIQTPSDPEAVIDGLIFGDGTHHKRRLDTSLAVHSQGRTYATLRVCKQDSVREEIHTILDDAGYKFTTPKSANGDRVYYFGKRPFAKDVPHTRDGEYIGSFIHGWWLADGSKTESSRSSTSNLTQTISTANREAAEWLVEHAPFAGYTVVSHKIKDRREGDGSFPNGKPLHVVRLRHSVVWELESMESVGTDEVFCVEEPETQSFTLGTGMVTGNCATAASSFASFGLLLNGSGVGRCYDDDMMLVDWDEAPKMVMKISSSHPDFEEARKTLDPTPFKEVLGDESRWRGHQVEDSREGWMKALELYETMTFRKEDQNLLILDFSNVRPSGSPIGGMQGRPSCGPVPTMQAFANVRDKVVGRGLPRWLQAMMVDHFFAESVLVGGARRAARIATKSWRDEGIFEFINCKQEGDLWSANNSVAVDEEFWQKVHQEDTRAREVFDAVTYAAYHHGTGEPGFLNLHRLNNNEKGLDWEELKKGEWLGSEKYTVEPETKSYLGFLAAAVKNKRYKFIVNPCAEIPLLILGGYCVIGDVVPFHCKDQEEFEDACRHTARALVRVNTMDSLYRGEVRRTNRIGVGVTGLHEWLWDRHGISFREAVRSPALSGDWEIDLQTARRASELSADEYAARLGLSHPHTVTTIKPAGTTSKLFGLTEGCHLPAMAYYLRWVQFRSDDPLVSEYESHGYPIKELQTYKGMTAVGFPTKLPIADLGMGDRLTFAGDATMQEQFEWLRRLESSWLGPRGNQVSYTLKYDPEEVSYEQFREAMLANMDSIRCCSVMPQVDTTKYEYQPEEPITEEQYDDMMSHIDRMKEDIGREHVDCGSGGCPIDFNDD